MTYRLVLPLALDITLVSRDIFDTAEAAAAAADLLTEYPALEVWDEERTKEISTRKVFFPEKARKK